MFRFRLHLEDGSGGGDATYSVMIQPAEVEDESPFVGLLQVEAAKSLPTLATAAREGCVMPSRAGSQAR